MSCYNLLSQTSQKHLYKINSQITIKPQVNYDHKILCNSHTHMQYTHSHIQYWTYKKHVYSQNKNNNFHWGMEMIFPIKFLMKSNVK